VIQGFLLASAYKLEIRFQYGSVMLVVLIEAMATGM